MAIKIKNNQSFIDLTSPVMIDIENNVINLHTTIDNSSVSTVINAINYMNDTYEKAVADKITTLAGLGIDNDNITKIISEISPEPITLYINTYGGILHDCLAVINTMKSSALPIITVCTGYAYSAGFWIFIHGDVRILSQGADLMYHQLSSGTYGTKTSMNDDIERTNQIHDRFKNMILEQTKLKSEDLDLWDREQRDVYFDYDLALKYGICDDITKLAENGLVEIDETINSADVVLNTETTENTEVVEDGK